MTSVLQYEKVLDSHCVLREVPGYNFSDNVVLVVRIGTEAELCSTGLPAAWRCQIRWCWHTTLPFVCQNEFQMWARCRNQGDQRDTSFSETSAFIWIQRGTVLEITPCCKIKTSILIECRVIFVYFLWSYWCGQTPYTRIRIFSTKLKNYHF